MIVGQQAVHDGGRGLRTCRDRPGHRRHFRVDVARGEHSRCGAEVLAQPRPVMQRREDQQSSPRHPAAVGEPDLRQFTVGGDKFGDRPLVDRNTRRRQAGAVRGVQVRGPSVSSTTFSLQPRNSSALCTARSPRQSTANGSSRTSQPWQKGQWKTDFPHNSARPGSAGGRYAIPVASTTRRARSRLPSASPSMNPPSTPSAETTSPVRTSTLGYVASSRLPIAYSSAGARPSCPRRPPIPCAAGLLWCPASTTSVRRLARPSTKAALSPAAPPPTIAQSHPTSMTRACRRRSKLPS